MVLLETGDNKMTPMELRNFRKQYENPDEQIKKLKRRNVFLVLILYCRYILCYYFAV